MVENGVEVFVEHAWAGVEAALSGLSPTRRYKLSAELGCPRVRGKGVRG